jgi:hypothetical protein
VQNPTYPCYQVSFENTEFPDGSSGLGWTIAPASDQSCLQTLTPEQINAARFVGLVPGSPAANPGAVCQEDGYQFGFVEECIPNGFRYTCVGINQSLPFFSTFPESKCASAPYDPQNFDAFGFLSPAQVASGQDVIGCGGVKDPQDPTGPTDPTDPTDPGTSTDPSDIEDPGTEPPADVCSYRWEAGAWTGEATCGTSSTLHRTVSCVASTCGGPGPVIGSADGLDLPGSDPLMQASYGFGPDGAKLIPAQLGPPIGNISSVTVSPSYCYDSIGQAPVTKYVGTQAGCSFTSETVTGEWQEPYGGDPTCSASAFRTKSIVCKNSNGDTVDASLCTLNLQNGGAENTSAYEPEVGNFSGCTAEWKPVSFDIGCKVSGQPTGTEKGPVFYSYIENQCVRSDGTVLTGVDTVSCSGPKGTDGYAVTGSCSPTFFAYGQTACVGPKALIIESGFSDYRAMYEGGGAAACLGAGMNCCAIQSVDYNDGRGVITQIVGTIAEPVTRLTYYMDFDSYETCYGSRVIFPDGTVKEDWCILGYAADNSPIYGQCNPSTEGQCERQIAERFPVGGSGREWRKNP